MDKSFTLHLNEHVEIAKLNKKSTNRFVDVVFWHFTTINIIPLETKRTSISNWLWISWQHFSISHLNVYIVLVFKNSPAIVVD